MVVKCGVFLSTDVDSGVQESPNEQSEEILVVQGSDACIEPITMVIKSSNTLVAHPAVLCTHKHVVFAVAAPLFAAS